MRITIMTETASNTIIKFSPIASPADIVAIANENTNCYEWRCYESGDTPNPCILI